MSAFATPSSVPMVSPPPAIALAAKVADEGWAEVTHALGAGRWAMPLCLLTSPMGFDAVDAAPPEHNTLAFIRAGGNVIGRRSRRVEEQLAQPAPGFGLQPSFIPTHYRAPGGIRFAHLYFTDALLTPAAMEMFGSQARRGSILIDDRPFIRDPELRRMADEYLVAALDRGAPATSLEMDGRAALIATALVRRHSVLAARPEVRPMALAPLKLSRAKEYIEEHLDEDFDLDGLARAAELSPFHFARAFKREMGIPPHRYLMERRVDRARVLLAQTALGLAEIALACGFAGQSHFTTAFKRHTGVTPGAWRAAVLH